MRCAAPIASTAAMRQSVPMTISAFGYPSKYRKNRYRYGTMTVRLSRSDFQPVARMAQSLPDFANVCDRRRLDLMPARCLCLLSLVGSLVLFLAGCAQGQLAAPLDVPTSPVLSPGPVDATTGSTEPTPLPAPPLAQAEEPLSGLIAEIPTDTEALLSANPSLADQSEIGAGTPLVVPFSQTDEDQP